MINDSETDASHPSVRPPRSDSWRPADGGVPAPRYGSRTPPPGSPIGWMREVITSSGQARRRALAIGAGVLLALLTVLVADGVAPGILADPIDIYIGGGISACVARDFPRHLLSCPNVGYPTEYRASFGQPVNWLTGFFHWSGFDLVDSVRIVWALGIVLGFWGARRFFARVTSIAWLAWVGVLSFMLAPIVSGQGGYGAVQIGFALVPAYLLLDLRLAEGLRADLGRGRLVGRVAAVVLSRTIGLMIDPYSFVIASVGVLAVWALWAWRGRGAGRRGRSVAGLLVVGATYVIAYFLYSRSVQTGGFVVESLDYFRGAGIDLYGLLVPSSKVWWASFTDLHHNVGALQGYSDGHNIYDIYLGLPLIVLAVTGTVVGGRRSAPAGARAVAAVSGLICLLLSLGPSLRVDDYRSGTSSTVLGYTMPADAATVATPWSWVYQHIPGISNMRAVWRWDLGTRLAFVVLAVLALTWWVGRCRSPRTRWVPVVVALALVIDSAGDIPVQVRQGHAFLQQEVRFQADVTTPLAPLVRPGERTILYGAGGVSPGANDYLANFICSTVDVRCYNAGGDKALVNALSKMPAIAVSVLVDHARQGDAAVEKALQKMFHDNQLDVVVLVNFDLAAQVSIWPPPASLRARGASSGTKMFADPTKFDRVSTPYFTVIRPRSAP